MRSTIPPSRGLRRLGFVLLFAGVAALPGVRAVAAPATAPAAVAAESTASASQNELDRAKRDLERLAALPQDEPLLEERRSALRRIIALLGAQEQRQSRTEVAPASTEPGTATLSPVGPYPVGAVDALRDRRDTLASQQSLLSSSLRTLQSELEALVQARRKADEVLRLREEQAARAAGKDRERLQLAVALATLQARVAALEVARADGERRDGQARLEALARQSATLDAEIERVRQAQMLDQSGLAAVAESTSKLRQGLTRELAQTRKLLAAAETQGTGGDEAAARTVAAYRAALAALSELDQIAQGRDGAWRLRQKALEAQSDPDRRRASLVELQTAIDQIDARLRVTTEQLNSVRASGRAQRLQLDELPAGDARRAPEQRALDALQVEIDARERVEEALARLRLLLSRSRDDIGAREPVTWSEHLYQLAHDARRLGRDVWEYELFNATESSVVDGRTVTLDYGITVGKSVGVLILFALGLWLAQFLARKVVALIVRRTDVDEQFGKVLYRWVMWTLALIVLIVTLKLARIPLTAFAFLGGALAIGVGFGTQNIIKNLISGIIILFERKIRVGDVVTIGALSGTVAAIDLRATTVRGFDGIDIIVPNSNLLENQVSNWTYSDATVRRVVEVAVAYDTDLHVAIGLLKAAAASVAGVLQNPEPEVLVTNFGADGIEFRLQFWVQLNAGLSGPVVESNLRIAIAGSFRRAGISIPFPQRDVHLHTSPPG